MQQRYPWLSTEPAAIDKRALLVTGALDRRALAHLNAGGRVWLMLGDNPDGQGIHYFPGSGGALGTVVGNGRALRGFPQEGFCDLQFFNLLQGAYPLPIDRWPAELDPIVGGIRTNAGFLSKHKNLSRFAYAVEGKAADGKLLITTFRIRDHLDDAYPEAISVFDALMRYAAGSDFDPKLAIPDEAYNRLVSE